MITITIVNRAINDQESQQFLKSLAYSHSGTVPYEISDEQSSNSIINIFLPDDCLVFGNSWDKYIKHAIDNGLPKHGLGKNFFPSWEGYVQRYMGLQNRRPPEGIFSDMKVVLATK